MKMTGFYMKCDTGMKWINDLGSMLNCWNAETTTRAALILKKFDYELLHVKEIISKVALRHCDYERIPPKAC